VLAGYRRMKGLTKAEKATRRYVRHDIQRMKAQLKPTLLNRLWHSKPADWLKTRLGNRTYHDHVLQDNEKTSTAEANSAALLGQLKSFGFNDHIREAVKRMLEHNKQPAFSLRYYDIHKPDTDYVLHFKKIPSTDVYYFEKFDATLRPDMKSLLQKETTVRTVSVSTMQNDALNAEEARKVLAGRFFEKLIDGVKSWLIYSPSQETGIERFAWDVDGALKAWPIVDMDQEGTRNALLRNLSMGREHQITLDLGNGKHVPVNVSVGPGAYGVGVKLHFRDVQGQPIDADRLVFRDRGQNNAVTVMAKIATSQRTGTNALTRLFRNQ